MHIKEQITETWYINHRVNLMLMDELNEEALTYSLSKRGGGNVGYQLAHMYNVRFWKRECDLVSQELALRNVFERKAGYAG